MRTYLLAPALALTLVGAPAAAQTPETDVLSVVQTLFDGMRAADTTAMRSTFHPDIRLITTGLRNGQPVAAVLPVERWLQGVASADQRLDERIYHPEVRMADGVATVWTFYTFHLGDRLTHCGYDAFQLALTPDGWKITQVADTRQEEGCEVEGGA